MKTVKKKGKEPQRVFDIVAENLVKNQGWQYCPKSEWKTKVRDATVTKPTKAKKRNPKKKK